MNCVICDRLENIKKSPRLIHEFSNSYLVVGDHQFYSGYAVLFFKNHAREMHDLSEPIRSAFFNELMSAGKAVAAAFRPWKVNYASLGNQDPHLHWHIFPRYESDPQHRQHPRANADQFTAFATTDEQAKLTAMKIREFLALECKS